MEGGGERGYARINLEEESHQKGTKATYSSERERTLRLVGFEAKWTEDVGPPGALATAGDCCSVNTRVTHPVAEYLPYIARVAQTV